FVPSAAVCGTPRSFPSARTWNDLAVSPASFSTAARGTPVHLLALRIIPSWVREGLGPLIFEVSKKVASLPEHSMAVRTLRPGYRWSTGSLLLAEQSLTG